MKKEKKAENTQHFVCKYTFSLLLYTTVYMDDLITCTNDTEKKKEN